MLETTHVVVHEPGLAVKGAGARHRRYAHRAVWWRKLVIPGTSFNVVAGLAGFAVHDLPFGVQAGVARRPEAVRVRLPVELNGAPLLGSLMPLELSVTLGYAPASVLSTQLGELQHTVLAPGKVSVKLPTFHWAGMVVFKRS